MAKYTAKLPAFATRGGFQFDGGQALAAALAGLSDRLSRRLLFEALTDAAEPMRAAMARNAPRRGGGVTLADEILIKAARVPSGVPAVAVGPSTGAFYGGFLEFGTAHASARPFARPAWDSQASAVTAAMGRSLWLELAGRGIQRPGSIGGGPVTGGPGGRHL